MSEYQKCPVCGGSGSVPLGFYDSIGWGGSTSAWSPTETCRCCQGKGIIIKPKETMEIEVTTSQ